MYRWFTLCGMESTAQALTPQQLRALHQEARFSDHLDALRRAQWQSPQ